MRLFAALRPPLQALDHLQAAVDAVVPPWRSAGPSPLRWTDPLQRHVTLAFYGEVPDGATDELAEALAEVAAGTRPLEVQLAGAGVFSGATLWAGVRAGDELVRLMAQCETAGQGISRLEPRERNRAHLTLARRGHRGARERVDLDAAVHALSVYRGPTWPAREIELIASELGEGRGGGPRHELIGRYHLGETT